jgi:hypothetical protein
MVRVAEAEMPPMTEAEQAEIEQMTLGDLEAIYERKKAH